MRKNVLVLLILSFSLLSIKGFAQDLNHIRNQYQKAAIDKDVCRTLIEKLSNEKEISSVELAYLGALETIWAKYASNPFSKLSTFKKGKEKIETAVKKAPDNSEIRYLRLSVQKNAPAILGYNNTMEKDAKYIMSNIEKVSSSPLKKMMEEVLKI